MLLFLHLKKYLSNFTAIFNDNWHLEIPKAIYFKFNICL